MIAYLKGTLEMVSEDSIILDNNNMGYQIRIPLSLIPQLPTIGQEVKVFTYLYVREDAMHLYGFMTSEDLSIFKMLLSVSGIGPKSALGILSAITPDELRLAIVTGDDVTIAKAPGVGKKTAQRLIIDLKDKLKLKDYGSAVGSEIQNAAQMSNGSDKKSEAIQALLYLGYSQSDAVKATRSIQDFETVEDVIKQALRQLARI